MIARHWTGIVKSGLEDRYVDHPRRETFPGLASLPGFVRACVLRRDVARGTEVRVVTLWQSLSAIKAFSGDEPEVAVVPAAVQAMMVDYDRQAPTTRSCTNSRRKSLTVRSGYNGVRVLAISRNVALRRARP